MFTNALLSLKRFLQTDTPTDQQTHSALRLIYVICFAVQAALSVVLALVLAILSRTLPKSGSDIDVVAQELVQANNISLIMLFVVMFLLLPSAFLIASLWQRKDKTSEDAISTRKSAKVAALASTIAVAVILAVSVWICVFAYFISISVQTLFLLIGLSLVLYFSGFMAIGFYAKALSKSV